MNFSLTLNLSKRGKGVDVRNDPYEGYELSLYENGVLVNSSYLNINQWEAFKSNCISQSANSFFLGGTRNTSSEKGSYVGYGKMILKNCRFYTRPLSSDEVKLNYDTRLAYDGKVNEY